MQHEKQKSSFTILQPGVTPLNQSESAFVFNSKKI